jgi:Cellulose binding domain
LGLVTAAGASLVAAALVVPHLTPATNPAAADTAATKQTATNKAATNKAATNKAPTNMAATNQTATSETATNKAATGGPGCDATVDTVATWSSGFQTTVTITNTAAVPLNNWYVAFTLPVTSRFASGWNGLWMDSGPSLMVHAPQWSQQLAPGATAVAGFVGTGPEAPTYTAINCD